MTMPTASQPRLGKNDLSGAKYFLRLKGRRECTLGDGESVPNRLHRYLFYVSP